MAKLQTDLKEFIALLNSHNVEYIVVGGHAVAFHGHPRFTGDIDFFVLERGRVISLGQPPNRIEILTSISGVDFEAAWESRVHTLLDDQPVALLGWSDLLRNKEASGRQKDRADLEKLHAVAKRTGAG